MAIAGLTFETNPGEPTTAGVVIVGAIAIWLAHILSRLVSKRSQGHLQLTPADVLTEARRSWSIVTAAIPATVIFVLAAAHLWTIQTAFVLADIVGVAALAVVGIGTAGGSDRRWSAGWATCAAWWQSASPSCSWRPGSTCSDWGPPALTGVAVARPGCPGNLALVAGSAGDDDR